MAWMNNPVFLINQNNNVKQNNNFSWEHFAERWIDLCLDQIKSKYNLQIMKGNKNEKRKSLQSN